MTSHRPGRSENAHTSRSMKTSAEQAPDTADLSEALERVNLLELGNRLEAARKAKRLRQPEVADQIISTSYLSRIESGQRRPDLKVLRALAERLDTTVHELLLGLTPRALAAKRVELDWAQLALRTGSASDALAKTTALLADLPTETRLHRLARFTYALAQEATGDIQGAATTLEELVEHNLDGARILETFTALCRCYRQLGELSRAIKVGERADRHVRELGLEGTSEHIRLTLTVAAAHTEAGDLSYAARLCQKALKHAENLSTPNERAGCYWNASIVEAERGNHDEAIAMAQKAIIILDEAESTRNAARLRTELGLLHLMANPPHIDEAFDHLVRAEADLTTSDCNPVDLAYNRLGQARVRFLRGDAKKAKAAVEECLAHAADASPMIAGQAHVLLGQIAFRQGDLDEARRLYIHSISLLTAVGADRRAAQLWFELGGHLLSVGAATEALDAFQRAGVSNGLRAPVVPEPAPVRVSSASARD